MAAKNYFLAAGAAAAAAAAAAASAAGAAGAEAAATGAEASAAGAGAGAATGAGAGAGASSFLPQAARATAATIAAKTSDLFIFRFLDEYEKTIFREWPTKSSQSIVQAGELELFQPNSGVYPYKPTYEQPRLSKLSKLVQKHHPNGKSGSHFKWPIGLCPAPASQRPASQPTVRVRRCWPCVTAQRLSCADRPDDASAQRLRPWRGNSRH